MKIFRSLDFIIITVISVLFISGLSIYVFNIPENPSFSLNDISFEMSEDNRSINFYIVANKGKIELKEIFIDNVTVLNWNADSNLIMHNEKSLVNFVYDWSAEREYVIKVVTIDDKYSESAVRAPLINPRLNIENISATVTSTLNFSSARVNYKADGYGVNSLHMLFFVYRSYEKSNRLVYIFYDEDYMTPESILRSDAIVKHSESYGLEIIKVNYQSLLENFQNKPEKVLIIVNPLMDSFGRRVENALPAPLIDPDYDGYIRDNSKYEKTILYDWMKEDGLILITVGSLQPYKNIIYEDGTFVHAKDSQEMFDAHQFLTDAYGDESIIKGSFTIGDYSPVRISGTLGLPYRRASFGFDKNAIERYGLQYYAYGDYELPFEQGRLNLTLPIFIRVGEGGWLAMGDEELWLSEEQLAHNLFLIYLQSVWDSEWIPYGWYWDSSTAYHESSGVINVDESLETELIPTDILGKNLVLKIVGISYLSDISKGSVIERIIEYEVP